MHGIAASSKQLKGCFIEGTFTARNLAPNDIKKIVDEVNKITYKAFGEEKDLIGRVYEYFLKDIKVCLIKNGYPPQYSPEVFRKVMEQVENFEENN